MFKAINYLLFSKRKPELDNEILEEFSPYMVNRYLSFYDESFSDYTNETINTYGNIFKNKEDQFRFYEQIVPRLQKRKINYIKKPKEEIESSKIPTAIPEFYSKREMEYFEL
jgi:hypothetical protein